MTNSSDVKNNTQLLAMAWRITGGLGVMVRSADFWLSVAVWALCAHYWITSPWWDQVISVFPNVLGFTLGGFAIFLGFGSDSFKKVLSHEDEMKSPYLSVSAAFLIFVFFQLITLLYAFAAKALHFGIPKCLESITNWINTVDVIASGFGYFLFIYSLVLALRAAMRIFRLSRWYHTLIIVEMKEEQIAERNEDSGE